MPLTSLRVVVGQTNWNLASASQYKTVSNISDSTGWEVSSTNDVAILFLDECVTGISEYPLLATPSTDLAACGGETLTSLGWGRNSASISAMFGGATDTLLRQTTHTLHSWETCANVSAEYYRVFSGFPCNTTSEQQDTLDRIQPSSFDTDGYFCFGGDTPGGICPGDSGGPVVVYESSGRDLLVGINSITLVV